MYEGGRVNSLYFYSGISLQRHIERTVKANKSVELH
jgi:hypothetical protein